MYVWINERGLKAFTFDKDAAPKDAIFIDTSKYDKLPPVSALVSVSNGQLKIHSPEEVFEKLKQMELNELNNRTTSYILKYYPHDKQRSDIIDLANAEDYLTSEGISFPQVRQAIFKEIQSGASYTQILETLNKTFNPNSNPTIAYWLEQVLKACFRQNFVFKVKQQYYEISKVISSATALPLPSYNIDVPFPDLHKG